MENTKRRKEEKKKGRMKDGRKQGPGCVFNINQINIRNTKYKYKIRDTNKEYEINCT